MSGMSEKAEVLMQGFAGELMDILSSAGFESFVVGGAVRDCLLNKPLEDIDMATSATVEQVQAALGNHDISIVATGIKHGTQTLIKSGTKIELTTYRTDGAYSDLRHPDSVYFAKSIEDDLARRDFTINAIAYNPSRGLVDEYDGQRDLSLKTIRCVGDAQTRFEEDALRILRAIRFSSTLDFEIEQSTADAIRKKAKNLCEISKERIRDEFCKLICGVNCVNVIRDYSDVIAVFIPEIAPLFGLDQHSKLHEYDAWEHSLQTLFHTESDKLELKIAALLHDIGKPASYDPAKGNRCFEGHAQISGEMSEDILRRLRFPKHFVNFVTQIIAGHDLRFEPNRIDAKHWMSKLGTDVYLGILQLKKADMIAHGAVAAAEVWRIDEIEDIAMDIISSNECYELRTLAIDGSDVIKAKPNIDGPTIGKVLDALLYAVIEERIPNTKDALLDELDYVVGKVQ